MTIRTHTALTALFADNITGDISPTDLRDFLDSIMGVYGSIGLGDGSTGQALASGVNEQMTEFLHDGVANGVTPAFGSNQITIDNAGVYAVSFNCSFEGVTGVIFQFELYKNGSAVVPHISAHRKTGNADVGSCGFTDNLTLAAADILTVWVEADGNGTPVWVESQFAVHRIG
jgi:hypothetical protein